MRPWYLRVDWLLNSIYGDPVEVELHIKGKKYPRTIHTEDDIHKAVGWALKWLGDRGFHWWCDIDTHQRLNDTHVILYPRQRSD